MLFNFIFSVWIHYLKTNIANYLILFSVKGSQTTIHEKCYVIFLYKFQKRDVRIWVLVSEYLQETHRSERELQDALQFQFLCRIVCSTILWYCPFIQSEKLLL